MFIILPKGQTTPSILDLSNLYRLSSSTYKNY